MKNIKILGFFLIGIALNLLAVSIIYVDIIQPMIAGFCIFEAYICIIHPEKITKE